MTKGVYKRIDEGVLRWFGHVERTENDRIAKRVYVGVCAGNRSVGRPRKRWTDTVKDCLRKRGLDIRQARRMVQDRNEWWRFEGECTRELEMSQLYEAFGVEICLWPSLQLKGYEGKTIFLS